MGSGRTAHGLNSGAGNTLASAPASFEAVGRRGDLRAMVGGGTRELGEGVELRARARGVTPHGTEHVERDARLRGAYNL